VKMWNAAFRSKALLLKFLAQNEESNSVYRRNARRFYLAAAALEEFRWQHGHGIASF
jgi:hypothetical protein